MFVAAIAATATAVHIYSDWWWIRGNGRRRECIWREKSGTSCAVTWCWSGQCTVHRHTADCTWVWSNDVLFELAPLSGWCYQVIMSRLEIFQGLFFSCSHLMKCGSRKVNVEKQALDLIDDEINWPGWFDAMCKDKTFLSRDIDEWNNKVIRQCPALHDVRRGVKRGTYWE